ncbi:MAG: hypothetical protein H8D56_10945 [Planctomycetes bacterium]|nr:hypothetical protein [Planctomycetota bacterium]MBL7145314.1 hypothetical protein [Phycisphaerae bacterium]
MEDILTSNVFSFFKYSTRDIFLKEYLNKLKLGFNISNQQANEAEFIFWPRFEENTEPDLVIIVGDYYLLIEAKYFSDFAEETKKTKAQLLREIEGGKLEADNYGKKFRLIAITADHYYKKDKFRVITSEFFSYFKWTNWQSVSSFIDNTLETNKNVKKRERDFALDLYNLLDKKNLRDFQSFDTLYNVRTLTDSGVSIFFESKTAKFRGDFIGFMDSLSLDRKLQLLRKTIFLGAKKKKFTPLFQGFVSSLPLDEKITPVRDSIYLSAQKGRFTPLLQLRKLKHTGTSIFYKEK